MARLTKTCPYCGKIQEQYVSPKISFGHKFITLHCGHTIIEKMADAKDYDSLVFNDGVTKLYPYQAESCRFGEEANFRFLVAHEPGLGKTIITLALLKEHPELLPCAILVKSTLKVQWFNEVIRKLGTDYLPQVITNGKEKPLPDIFKVFIISLDLLRNVDWLQDLPINTVIIDECQLIKNPESKRTNSVRALCDGKQNLIALSGTPIKNNAAEYFPILNLINPQKFSSYSKYLLHWVETKLGMYGTKSYGLKYPKEFQEFTKDMIIRRTFDQVKEEIGQNTEVLRQFRYVELESESKYNAEMEVFEKAFLNQGGDFTAVRNSLFKLKHIVGLDKVKTAIDFAAEFLIGTERKLTLFVHHRDVGKEIADGIRELCKDGGFDPPLVLTSDLDSTVRGHMALEFQENPAKRILIASTLSAGEGLNLQSCSDCVFVERQWNPANEEQAEGRFKRIGQKDSHIRATYLTVLGTIDEMLMELVERKRKIMANTLDFKDLESSDEILKELADILFKKGMKKWAGK